MASSDQIAKALKNDKLFAGVYAANELAAASKNEAPFTAIYNYSALDDADGGSHWCACFIEPNGYGHWFDSYGLPPDGADDALRKTTEFWRFMDDMCGVGNWDYNRRDVQSKRPSDVCGEWSVEYCRRRTFPTEKTWPDVMLPTAPERDAAVFRVAGLRRHHELGYSF